MSYRSTAIIILAAGDSSRMGQPKQLLKYDGRTLLQIAIDTADQSEADAKLLVLGANAGKIQNEIELKSLSLTINQDWGLGMSKSLEVALRQLLSENIIIDQILVLLSDQPYISPSLLKEIINTQASSGKGIVACKYEDTLGVPVLFPKGKIDIDTKEDYDRLMGK